MSCEICNNEWSTVGAFISCYGCAKYYHNKCVSIKASVSDVLTSSDANGLQWFCKNCRTTSTSRLFAKLQDYQKSADKISALAMNLLDMVVQHQSDAQNLNDILNTINSRQPANSLQASNSLQLSRKTRSKSASCLPDNNTSSTAPNVAPAAVIHIDESLAAVNSVPVTPAPVSPVPVLSVPSVALQDIPVPEIAVSSSAITNQLTDSSSSDLVIIKKRVRKSIFVSRFAASTSINDIVKYISKKTVNPNLEQLVRCFKYNTDITREISSFRITPPEEYFSSLLDTNFWPDGTLVKEFLPRSNANSLQIPAKN